MKKAVTNSIFHISVFPYLTKIYRNIQSAGHFIIYAMDGTVNRTYIIPEVN